MPLPITSQPRVRVDGKFFRLGDQKFYLKGVTYGPFAPDAQGETFASPEQTRRDFALLRDLGANVVRVYHVPQRWLLDLALEYGLRLLIDIPWNKHVCFLDSTNEKKAARLAVQEAARMGAGHPAVFAYSVVNEIPPDIVRWSGARRIAEFIDDLVEEVKDIDPECLCTFTNYPPTEYLRPQNLDFFCFNVYLHHRRPFENYLARLQMIADSKPIILGEFGVDSIREGEERKCELLGWQIEDAFRGGLAGTVVFSFTDDWWRAGQRVSDWAMGITTRDRLPKASFETVKQAFAIAPHFPLIQCPKVSVVVASYNGGRTLKACLDSLGKLNYPNYEVILVDDGSTDATPQIASLYHNIRYIRHENRGLSVARNTGIALAEGEIVAFTDSDCRADEDWLYYLVGDLTSSKFTGIGGHNFLPPEDSLIAAAVMASPGGPAHVMLNDRLAEHIPGCNMAFYKWALDEIGGFDPIYRKAGDDVDVCWRLQQRGYRIGFTPAGFVWHYRRSTVNAYLKQQGGYGEAEALLVRKHPEYFSSLGGSIWAGRIYTAAKLGVATRKNIIYHGVFGSALFQSLYEAPPAMTLMLMTSFEYHILFTLPLFVLSVPFRFLLPVAITSFLISLGICVAAAFQAELPRNKRAFWSKPLIALLYFLQPFARGWARYKGRLTYRPTPSGAHEKLDSMALKDSGEALDEIQYWADTWVDRIEFINDILNRLDAEGWQSKPDGGWNEYDIEIFGSRWSTVQFTTVAELYSQGKQLYRCRLKTEWSLPAKVTFWGTLAFELLIIGFVGKEIAWIWLLLLTMPALAWFLNQEQRNLQSLMVVFMNEVARKRGMIKITHPSEGKKSGEDTVPPKKTEPVKKT
ncbi:MAG: glycosyltransferase [Verrucomicrobiota bacterium]